MDPLTPVEREWGRRLAASGTDGCLSAEALISLAERGKSSPNYSTAMSHVARCPNCRATLKELRAADALRPRTSFRFGWTGRLGIAAAIAAAAVLGFLLLRPGMDVPGLAPGGPVAKSVPSPAKGRTDPLPVPKSSPNQVTPETRIAKSSEPEPKPIAPAKPKRASSRFAKSKPKRPAEEAVVPDSREEHRELVASQPEGFSSASILEGEVLTLNHEVGEVCPRNWNEGEVVPKRRGGGTGAL